MVSSSSSDAVGSVVLEDDDASFVLRENLHAGAAIASARAANAMADRRAAIASTFAHDGSRRADSVVAVGGVAKWEGD